MPELTASDEVLLAAANIAKGDHEKEFTEWELTVEAWKLNKNRWGLRGFEDQYPDHKRVMMEVMGHGGLVRDRYLVRTRSNHYKVTSSGLARAINIAAPRDTRQRSLHTYDAIREFAFHRVFESYLRGPEEPRTWLGAASFLNLQRNDPDMLEAQLSRVHDAITLARQFMDETSRGDLRRGDSDRSISRERLEKLEAFLGVLEERFHAQFEAIRAKAS